MGEEENADCPKFLEERFKPSEFWAGHVLIGTASIYALYHVVTDKCLSYKAYYLLLGHSLCGTLGLGNEGTEDWQVSIFKYSTLVAQTVVLPMITHDIYFYTGLSSDFVKYLHMSIAALPMIGELVLEEDSENNILVDLSIMANVASLAYYNHEANHLWPQVLLLLTVLHNYVLRPFLQYKGVSRNERIALNNIFQIFLSILCLQEVTP